MQKLTGGAIAALVGAVLIWMAAPAGAGPIVDPTALQPEPPPGAVCRADGAWTICQTTFLVDVVNEPILDFGLPCGTVYETIFDPREGIRWYLDAKLVKRFVSQNAEGTWILSPTGAGPAVTVALHGNWRTSTPCRAMSRAGRRPSTGAASPSGHRRRRDRPYRRARSPDGTHRGVFRITDDPQVAPALCAALTA